MDIDLRSPTEQQGDSPERRAIFEDTNGRNKIRKMLGWQQIADHVYNELVGDADLGGVIGGITGILERCRLGNLPGA